MTERLEHVPPHAPPHGPLRHDPSATGRREALAAAPADRPPRELGPLWLLTVLLRRRYFIAGTALLVGVATVAAGLALIRREFTSTASFMPQARSGGSAVSGLAAQFGVALPASEGTQSPAFYMDLVQSREILGRALDGRYAAARGDTASRRVALADVLEIPPAPPHLRRDRAMRALRERVAVTLNQKSGVLTIAVTMRSPVVAQQVAARIIDEVNRFNLESRQSQASAERRFTQARLREVRDELRAAEGRLQDFLQRNRNYGNSPQLTFQYGRLARDVEERQSVYTSVLQAHERARIEEVRDTPVITVVERAEVPVRPDPRGLAARGVIAALLGALLASLLVAVPALAGWWRARGDDTVLEFEAVRAEALGDLTHPWRPIARYLRRKPTAGP